MTREEAIEELERLLRHWDDLENDKRCFWGYDKEAVALALIALRPVSREQVWRGEWIPVEDNAFYNRCSKCGKIAIGKHSFCKNCGSPMTDEAVDIIMRRLETLYETT